MRAESQLPDPPRKRRRRYNDGGHAHLLAVSCFQQQPFLSKDRSRAWVVEALRRARDKHGFDLWAYAIMPEHIHVLLWPGENAYDISRIQGTITRSVTQMAVRFVQHQAPWFLPKMLDLQPNGKQAYRFWQRGGGYDRNLWSPAVIWQSIEYIHANPVRRELCETPAQWPWSSAREYEGRPGSISIDFDSLPEDPREDRSRSRRRR